MLWDGLQLVPQKTIRPVLLIGTLGITRTCHATGCSARIGTPRPLIPVIPIRQFGFRCSRCDEFWTSELNLNNSDGRLRPSRRLVSSVDFQSFGPARDSATRSARLSRNPALLQEGYRKTPPNRNALARFISIDPYNPNSPAPAWSLPSATADTCGITGAIGKLPTIVLTATTGRGCRDRLDVRF